MFCLKLDCNGIKCPKCFVAKGRYKQSICLLVLYFDFLLTDLYPYID